MPIESTAFQGQDVLASLMGPQGQAEAFVTPQAKPVLTEQDMAQGMLGALSPMGAMNTNRPSQSALDSAEAELAFVRRMGMGEGFGALGGGIRSLMLGPKVAKMRAEANEAQVRAENLKLERSGLENRKINNELQSQERQLKIEAGMDALSRLEANTSENLAEDIKLAGGEYNERTQAPKSNLEKIVEMQQSGNMGQMDLESLAKFRPGLISRMNQKFSRFTSEAVIKELNDAGEAYRGYQDSLTKLSAAKIKAAGKGKSGPDAYRENFKAYTTALTGINRVIEDIKTLDRELVTPDAVASMLTEIMPGLKTVNEFGQKTGLVKSDDPLSFKETAQAVDEYWKTGNTKSLDAIQGKFSQTVEKSTALEGKSPKSPDSVKEKKAPIKVSAPTAKTKKEETSNFLDSLGGLEEDEDE